MAPQSASSPPQEYLNFYNNSLVAEQHLEAVDFEVDLQVFDWATLLSESDVQRRYEILKEIQQLFYQDVPGRQLAWTRPAIDHPRLAGQRPSARQ